ncbi:MAG: PAS domain-containing protein [Desulfuromonadaceae bacterium]|nr:PAS domain-containing protein [Desulfuromonadaceae bacterium]
MKIMKKKDHKGTRLLWQIYPAFFMVTLVAILLGIWYSSAVLKRFQHQSLRESLSAQATLVAFQVGRLLEDEPSTAAHKIQDLCREAGLRTKTRVTVVLPGGDVLGDSEEEPQRMENHARRPEVVQALQGETGISERYSRTVNKEMVYLALPVTTPQGIQAVVRTAKSMDEVETAISHLRQRIVLGGLVVIVLVALICLVISRRISRPLEQIRLKAKGYADGYLHQRLYVTGSSEIVDLAQALNQMARQLNERISTIDKQRQEQEAVLGSMVEGVIAVDSAENILRLNQAAARLLEVDGGESVGRSLQEVVRRAELLDFVREALGGDASLEKDLQLFHDGQEISLQVHGTPLRGEGDSAIGALVVLNDTTRLRRLETMRRDFVANVSHELKTPITAIKGFVETLLDGALDNREESERFLHIVERQVDRLTVIIEDLMSLSRIELGEEHQGFVLQKARLAPVVQEAVNDCVMTAQQRGIQLKLECEDLLQVEMNAPLLEQALSNLIDNAVKYSSKDSEVVIRCFVQEDAAVIEVEDRGCGIESEHLPRLFERFYRVDKARSRQAGGSGLGLAIVKHIVQIHDGRIDVVSTPGQGSTFSIRLPREPDRLTKRSGA